MEQTREREAAAAKGRSAPELNEFGAVVYRLMLARGYRTSAKLAELMREERAGGYTITRQAVDNYATGRRSVPYTFVERFTEVLDLDYEERRNLAWAYAYGQGQG